MRKMNRSAFTLVELIVVITILAILATVAFISFGGQTGKAKDAKIVSDIRSISGKINVMMTNKDKKVSDFLTGSLTVNEVTGTGAGIALNPGDNYKVGTINFYALQEKQEKFQDTTDKENPKDYIYAYVSNSSVGVFNIAGQTTNADSTFNAVVDGSYYEATEDGSDVNSLISSSTDNTAVENGKPIVGSLY